MTHHDSHSARLSLSPLFNPKRICVIGASASVNKAGHQMMQSLSDFPGDLIPVNPRATEILGRKSYPRARDIPSQVDLAILTVPAAAVPDAIRDCASAKIPFVMICGGGFAEASLVCP